ncbi:MFS transporter [Mesorhizobium sp. SP-1A]|uniref:CynX/NimT family MFS transporter n=1 Tax=Mesorhizobium sp. SP-1A TaxID=3077840 RepID=UPI0028F6EA22|nr:MFS transporter [Mesorhizobium sp. SP-1A]
MAGNSARPGLSQLIFGLSVVIIAFNLRTVFSSASAVLPEIVESYGLDPFAVGALTTLPVICLGAFSPCGPLMSRAFGLERSLLVVTLVLALGLGLRGLPSSWTLFAGTAFAGAAIAVGNVLLPSLVKQHFPQRVAALTGGYSMSLCLGAACAAGLTLPIERALQGSVEAALASWAIPALFAAAAWLPQAITRTDAGSAEDGQTGTVWRDPRAWQITLFMGLQSALAYCVFGWLVPILRERGVEAVSAGSVVALSVIAQGFACLVAPHFAVRLRDQKVIAVFCCVISVASLEAMLFAPLATIEVWAVLLGLGQGALIALALTIIVLRSPNAVVASHLSALAQFVGYLLAAIGPLFVGWIRAGTGTFAWCSVLFAFVGAAMAVNGWLAGRPGYIAERSPRPDAVPTER